MSDFLVAARELEQKRRRITEANKRVAERVAAHDAKHNGELKDFMQADEKASRDRDIELRLMKLDYGSTAPYPERQRYVIQMWVAMSESKKYKGIRDPNEPGADIRAAREHEADMRAAFGYTEAEFLRSFGHLEPGLAAKQERHQKRQRQEAGLAQALREAKDDYDEDAIPVPPPLPDYLKPISSQQAFLRQEQEAWGRLQRNDDLGWGAFFGEPRADPAVYDHWTDESIESKRREELVREFLQRQPEFYERELRGIVDPAFEDFKGRWAHARAPLGVATGNAAPGQALDVQLAGAVAATSDTGAEVKAGDNLGVVFAGDYYRDDATGLPMPAVLMRGTGAQLNQEHEPAPVGRSDGVVFLDPAGGGSRVYAAIGLAMNRRRIQQQNADLDREVAAAMEDEENEPRAGGRSYDPQSDPGYQRYKELRDTLGQPQAGISEDQLKWILDHTGLDRKPLQQRAHDRAFAAAGEPTFLWFRPKITYTMGSTAGITRNLWSNPTAGDRLALSLATSDTWDEAQLRARAGVSTLLLARPGDDFGDPLAMEPLLSGQETKAVAATSAPAKAERTRIVHRAWKKAHKLDHKAQRAAQRAQQRGRR